MYQYMNTIVYVLYWFFISLDLVLIELVVYVCHMLSVSLNEIEPSVAEMVLGKRRLRFEQTKLILNARGY